MRSAHRDRTLHLYWVVSVLVVGLFASFAQADDDAYTGDPELSVRLFDEGEALREEGRTNEAATKYWEAVEANLRNFRAHVRYQETALKAGDPKDELIKDYKSFIDDYPKVFALKLHLLRVTRKPADRLKELTALKTANPEMYDTDVEIGRAHLALGNPAAAVDPLVKALALCPATRKDVPILLADAEFAAGKPKDARKRLEDAVRSEPEFFDAHLALARFDLAEKQYPAAIKRADTVLQLRPTLLGAFLIKGEAQNRLDDRNGALTTLVAARRVNPDNLPVKLAYADYLGGEEAGRDGAVALYAEALAVDPENLHALFAMGWTLERQEKYEEAEAKYREMVSIEPDLVVAINAVGYTLYMQGRVSESQVQFKKAADLDPAYASAVLNLGTTFDAQAKYDDAIKIYERFLKKHPKNLRALVNCAFDYEALGSFPKALKLLEEAHKVDPTDALVVVWVADNNYFQKKWKEAEQWYKKAVEMDDTSFFGWRGLGYTYGHLKRWEDAVKALEKARSIDPKDLDVYLALGDVYFEELEDLESALGVFQEYVQRGGNDPAIQDLIVEIQKQLQKK